MKQVTSSAMPDENVQLEIDTFAAVTRIDAVVKVARENAGRSVPVPKPIIKTQAISQVIAPALATVSV